MSQITLIFVAFFLVWLNGFFVAAEFGLVKLRNTQVQTLKNTHGTRGSILVELHKRLDTYLSACQLGITLASLGLGWVGEPAFAELIEPALQRLGIFSHATVTGISFFTAFFIISFLHIVAGELAPKSLAIRQPEKISLWTGLPLYYFYWLMYPFIWLLNHSANLMLKLLGLATAIETAHYSSDELKLILHSSPLHNELQKEEVDILGNVVDFVELKVADVMRPIDELVAIALTRPLAEIMRSIAQFHYSRYPVYKTDAHHIIGILHVKDIFFATQSEPGAAFALEKLIRPALSVHTDWSAIDLFRQFRAGLSHFAMVKHSSSDTIVGFVTLDDILNTLLGQIRDEFNVPTANLVRSKDGSFVMKGNTPLYVLEKQLNIEFPPMEANTVTGLLLTHLERMPKSNERVSFEHFDIVVMKVKGPKVLLVKIYPRLK